MTASRNVAKRAGHMTRTGALAAAALLSICCGAALAGEIYQYDIVGPYLRRTDSITAGAGNSKEVNSVVHMLDPWPPYAGNRRIPGNGERMSGAVERYRDVSKSSQMPATLSHPTSGQTGQSQGTSAATSTATSTASPATGR